MSEKVPYWEKLKDPRWQRKRLEIMERAGFQCESCGDVSTLHVHHRYYEKGKNPWDYTDESLVCVCDECHLRIPECAREFFDALSPHEDHLLSRLAGVLTLPGVGLQYVISAAREKFEAKKG